MLMWQYLHNNIKTQSAYENVSDGFDRLTSLFFVIIFILTIKYVYAMSALFIQQPQILLSNFTVYFRMRTAEVDIYMLVHIHIIYR